CSTPAIPRSSTVSCSSTLQSPVAACGAWTAFCGARISSPAGLLDRAQPLQRLGERLVARRQHQRLAVLADRPLRVALALVNSAGIEHRKHMARVDLD